MAEGMAIIAFEPAATAVIPVLPLVWWRGRGEVDGRFGYLIQDNAGVP